MKAVIICNNEEMIEKVSAVLHSAGYEIIAYRWLLKALDNFTEISPHLVIISTVDYPRHWKTFVQYARSGIIRDAPQLILYTGGQLNEEDEGKAGILRIRGSFAGTDADGLDHLRSILAQDDDIYAGTAGEPAAPQDEAAASKIASVLSAQKARLDATDTSRVAVSAGELMHMKFVDMSKRPRAAEKNVGFMYTDPSDGAFVTGAVTGFDGKGFDFTPDRPRALDALKQGLRIAGCTLLADGKIRHTAVFAGTITADSVHFSLGE